jgi:hypothetical protein
MNWFDPRARVDTLMLSVSRDDVESGSREVGAFLSGDS